MAKPPIVEGATATNPQTGEKIVYRGGKWYPAGGAAGIGSARQLVGKEAAQLDEARAVARQSDEAARTAERFVDVNRNQPTGGLMAIPKLSSVIGAFDPEVNQMNALTARMAPQQRVPGSGTTSDRDLSLYLQAVPSAAKPGKVNLAIAQQAREDTARRQAYAQFLDEYAGENGTLIGAERAWEQRIAKGEEYKRIGERLAQQQRQQRGRGQQPRAAAPAASPGAVRRYNPQTGRIE